MEVGTERLLAPAFRALFDHSPDASLVYIGTRMVAANRAAVRLFRAKDAADLLARHPSELAPATQEAGTPSAEIIAYNNRALRQQGRRRLSWIARRLDGSTFPADVTLTMVDLDGEEATLSIVHDLTAQRRHEEELTNARNRALAAAQARSEFLASTSHEIRTPMGSIIGFAELLETMETDPTKLDFIQTISRAGRQLLGLINDILDLSKLEAGKVTLDPQPLDLRDALEDVAALLAPRAGMKGVDFILWWEPGTPEGVVADGLRLRQMVTNLVGNAIKFTDQGRVEVAVTAEQDASEMARFRITVEDTGIGIAADKLDRIFGRYEQAETGTAARFGGSGLGLSIVRQLAELMGGTVNVESTPGAGSRFRVEVPLPLAPEAAPPPMPVPTGGRGRALLLGLTPRRIELMTQALRTAGFTVDVVDGNLPADAAEVASLVVADWAHASAGALPIPGRAVRVVVVSRQHVEDARGLLGANCDHVLLAPIQRDEWRALLAAVDARR
jgi:PAS domain S-box-containing protein